jgi:diaminohydroxyphosphoribosylaminopyrimidine deaminase/5-amino-6-(5-phosphoribosylamino)uracil reductase
MPSPSVDAEFMRRAIEVSRNGFPAPNPHVGCVVVLNGEIVGEGFCNHAGGRHAEANALVAAGDRAQNATAYVTLEPCNHFGRTPPCSEALIKAGVKRVVIASADRNPIAAGGASRLREAGIEVDEGVLEAEAAEANPQFLFAVRHRRPRVVVKAAMSLDGRIALPSGESKWITGPEARAEGHRLRAECGAVLVGRCTVETDDPQLTARILGVVNQPLRIVLDPAHRLKGNERVFDDQAPTLHVRPGGDLDVPQQVGQLDLQALLDQLFNRGVTGILVEGGAKTVSAFFRAGLVDQVELFVAPKLLGDGPSWLQGLELPRLADAPELSIEHSRTVGRDLWLSCSVPRSLPA